MAYAVAEAMRYNSLEDVPLRLESPQKLIGDSAKLNKFKEFRNRIEQESGAAEAIINNMMMRQIFNESGKFTTTQSCTEYMENAYGANNTKEINVTAAEVEKMYSFCKEVDGLGSKLINTVNGELTFCEDQLSKANQLKKSGADLAVRGSNAERLTSGRDVTKYGAVSNKDGDDTAEQEKLVNSYYRYMMICVNTCIRFLNSLQSVYMKNLRACFNEYGTIIRKYG